MAIAQAGEVQPGAGLRNILAPESLDFHPREIHIGGQWGRVYAVLDFPPAVGPAWLARAASAEGVTMALRAVPTDPTNVVLALNRAISQLAGRLATPGQNALTLQRTDAQLTDAQTLMMKIDAEQQSLFTVGVFLLVTAASVTEGMRRAKRVEGMLAAQGMRARVLAFRQEEGLKACGPWGIFPASLQGKAPFQLPAETLAAAFPFSSGGINHGHGIVLGHDQEGGLVLIDRWDPPPDAGITNKNFAILSPPGGGKSHAAKVMMLREWALGATVIVVDPEREYQGLCRQVGGAWLNAAGGATKINPFQPPALPREAGEDASSSHTLGLHIQWVQDFLQTYLPQLNAIQTALVDQAVEECYTGCGIPWDANPADYAPGQWPHMGTLHATCRNHAAEPSANAEWATLAALLRNAGEGVTARLWAGASTVPALTDADFVVLDIHDLQDAPDTVRRAQFLNVLGYAWDLVRADRQAHTVLIVDEAWMLIDAQAPEALKFMKSLSKRIRKYGGSLMVVTQNVMDFLADPIRGDGEPVLANAALTLLLRQGGKDLEALTGLFHLSEAEQDKLSSARVGEGLLIAGNTRTWLSVDTAPYEAAMLYGKAPAAP